MQSKHWDYERLRQGWAVFDSEFSSNRPLAVFANREDAARFMVVSHITEYPDALLVEVRNCWVPFWNGHGNPPVGEMPAPVPNEVNIP